MGDKHLISRALVDALEFLHPFLGGKIGNRAPFLISPIDAGLPRIRYFANGLDVDHVLTRVVAAIRLAQLGVNNRDLSDAPVTCCAIALGFRNGRQS